MSDLRIDYQALEFTHATLSRLAADFDGARHGLAGYDTALGSSAVSAALASVTGNWTYHRKQLVQRMRHLDTLVTQALAHFPATDSHLANSLEKR